ncbi:MAG TPA: carboxypeptidase-like regulatory domain-containing protein [Candidatus Thermoplasmatota archaeon]|nr:carboxypeptidase-like regulatory domain-containing protein [Candidatus Thermoplasmatota archaeon]
MPPEPTTYKYRNPPVRTRFRMRLPSLLLATFVVISGCSGSGAETAAPTPATTAPPATVTSDLGSIEGLVTNDETVPIEGVEVAIVELSKQTKTDAGGKFVFNELPGAKYRLIFQKLGYESNGKAVEVVVGEILPVSVVLTAIEIGSELYIQKFTFEGYLQCSVNAQYATNPCETASGPNKDRYTFELINGTVKEGIWELVWTPANGVTAQELELDICRMPDPDAVDEKFLCQGTIGSYYKYQTSGSPNVIRDDKIPHKTYKKYLVGAGAGLGEAPAYQQSFVIYGALCFNEVCPDDFTQQPPV